MRMRPPTARDVEVSEKLMAPDHGESGGLDGVLRSALHRASELHDLDIDAECDRNASEREGYEITKVEVCKASTEWHS